ncbi:GntR family transcriptional regulator [Phaeobacter gallaeciensis]|uniref:GntR family transcriptional regulator n=2 Tax=Roseobacteraceae TaxID=2854170 RepID=A0A366X8R9_9RHOB|nr:MULTISPECIES: GntR family transcriptional regulator [Roseobacteraceae]MBT3142294.1 GntR family transcriptional regulator [Falsiruegeria litorea]MBT8169599.1 GntR family transcriptional regulator [Falsiruegeria litorea]RBW61107.1 GntR family transcriptional regulator [Phaeobacter gallaeciensis]
MSLAQKTTATELKSTVEDIQLEIVQRICFLDYPPGEQLKEAELAAEFGVSRTPIRDAISRISHLGLVETRNGVGTVVVALSAEQIRHVYEMRLELAALIGTMSPCTITEIDCEMGRTLLQEAKALRTDFDPRQYIEINHRLHVLITSLIGNGTLRSFWWQTYCQAASTWYRQSKQRGSEMVQALVAELSDINTALELGDVAAIGYIQRTHIGYGYQRIKTHLLATYAER